jgi:hypothetical protein
MMRASIARKTLIDSPFQGATGSFRLLGVLAAALTMALGAPTVALGVVQVAPTLTGTAGDDDWFTSHVIVKWTYSGETSTQGCDTQELTADTPGTTLSCTAAAPGQVVTSAITVHIDQTPPTAIAATPARPPDSGLFYTAPLPINWSATDATSGVASCTELTYSGPEGPAVAPTGTCRDRAGNVSAPLPFIFTYGTPPTPAPIVATATAVPPTSAIGPTGTSTTAKPKAKSKRPTLTWRALPNVKYYNMQLFRNGHKIHSAWPTVAHYTLKPSWRFHGRTYKLAAGRYRWYVWPGYGPRSSHRYGRLLAKGVVAVPTP